MFGFVTSYTLFRHLPSGGEGKVKKYRQLAHTRKTSKIVNTDRPLDCGNLIGFEFCQI